MVTQIVDDSVYEAAEQFEVELLEPNIAASLGPISKTTVIIEGPNDGGLFTYRY
jgi:hypothetical protein